MNDVTGPTAPSAQRLRGKVAIITGGASGFGNCTAKLFVQHGAKVVIADVQDELGTSLCNEIISSIINTAHQENVYKDIISYIHCDVSNENDVKNLIDHTISKHGKLDIMFNNAGIFGDPNQCILQTTNENFKNVFETNVYGGFLGAKHAAAVMIPRTSGVILFTASVASIMAGGGSPHSYTTSKHAVLGLMRSLSLEMAQYGIRVNSISPGAFSTQLTTSALQMDEDTLNKVICECSVLKGVAPEPMNVAHAALFLASDEAKYVNGSNFVIDGGYSVTNPSLCIALDKFMA